MTPAALSGLDLLATAVVLVDAGDLIQGNPFATHWARHPAAVHPIVDALNRMQYDAAAPGNHEFNFGLDVMQRALAGALVLLKEGDGPVRDAAALLDDPTELVRIRVVTELKAVGSEAALAALRKRREKETCPEILEMLKGI